MGVLLAHAHALSVAACRRLTPGRCVAASLNVGIRNRPRTAGIACMPFSSPSQLGADNGHVCSGALTHFGTPDRAASSTLHGTRLEEMTVPWSRRLFSSQAFIRVLAPQTVFSYYVSHSWRSARRLRDVAPAQCWRRALCANVRWSAASTWDVETDAASGSVNAATSSTATVASPMDESLFKEQLRPLFGPEHDSAAAMLERSPPPGVTIVRNRAAAMRVIDRLWEHYRESVLLFGQHGMTVPGTQRQLEGARILANSNGHVNGATPSQEDGSLPFTSADWLAHSQRYHAWDTETIGVDPNETSPVGHGQVICLSAFCGPLVNFGNGPRLWIDNYGDAEGTLDLFKSYFENADIPKVWHNYSFDRAVLYNHGIDCHGFAGDTMHMSRLLDASRLRYSLESLTEDFLLRKKQTMRELFGKPRILKNGNPGKEIVVPSTVELQTNPDTIYRWVQYSTFDAEATWYLRDTLERRLRALSVRGSERSMFDLYTDSFVPFGELLTDMERVGFKIDIGRLAEAQRIAESDRQNYAAVFRQWATRHCLDAAFMNLESENQKRQFFFAPVCNRKTNELLPAERTFEVENKEPSADPQEKRKRKKRSIQITGLGLPPVAYTASGWPACGTPVLRKLAGAPTETPPRGGLLFEFLTNQRGETAEDAMKACEAVESLLEAGAVGTLLDSFIDPLQKLADENGRIHASLNLNTETGRLSSRRPNLQNQPALEKDRYHVRDAFTCEEGNILIVADYGQLELRLLAHIANCHSMIAAFQAGGDFHSRTTCGMYPHIAEAVARGDVLLEPEASATSENGSSKPLLKDVYPTERRRAKTLNFSIAYGKTPTGLARDWGTSLKEARETVDAWYRDRPEVRLWQERAIQYARAHGYVKTLLGRRRPLPDINSPNATMARHAERAAINTPLQGSAADVVMKAMLQIHRDARLAQLGWRMILQVHDEIILEGPEESVEEAEEIVVHLMRHPFRDPLRVDLAVSASHAKTWYRAK
jgi:DNA polymerase-1